MLDIPDNSHHNGSSPQPDANPSRESAGTYHKKNSKFPDNFVERLKTIHSFRNQNAIDNVYMEFTMLRGHCPDAPEVDDLTPEDVPGVICMSNYDSENKETWQEFIDRKTKLQTEREEVHDPFLASWYAKTEDKPNPWMSDTHEQIADAYKEALNNIFRFSSPIASPTGHGTNVGSSPIEDCAIMTDIATALLSVSTLIAEGMGESTDDAKIEWRWSRALCVLAGLGFPTLRLFAEKLSRTESEWDYWATCTDEELRADVLQARGISGYPISLLRADYTDLQRVCVEGQLDPRWIKASLATHLFKYVRLINNFNGQPALWMGYRGTYSHIPFDAEGLKQSLSTPINKNLRQNICMHLGIRQARGKDRMDIDCKIDAVLKHIHPCDFAAVRDLKSTPYLIVPSGVTISPAHERKGEYKWINTGIQISNLAEIDLNSGKVEETVVDGPQTIAMDWPRGSMTEAENKTWWANLPKIVSPMLPSEMIKTMIRNINDLDHPIGYWSLMDATMLIDLCRDDLAGTPTGNAIITEYPLMIVYPMGHTKETTTNQGKTNFGRVIGNVFSQGLPVTLSSKTPSAPAQRVMGSAIEKYGTGIIDEFQLPDSHDHFLAQASLQSLSTGGKGGPGRAGENSEGFALKHPLIFTSKVAAFPPDIRNRSIPTFMDVITDASRCTSADLSIIMSGKISFHIRLSALMWIHKSGFVTKVSTLPLIQGKLRFDGHMSIASMLAGDSFQDINSYLDAAEIQCSKQLLLADESGLSDNIGINSQFDPVYYFRACSEHVLHQLSEQTSENIVVCLPVMRAIIEDLGARKFIDIVRQYGGKERALLLKFSDAIKEKRMHRPDGWEIEWTKKKGGNVINGNGKSGPASQARECVVVVNRGSDEAVNTASRTHTSSQASVN
jgi:hypothetical protein